MPGNETIEIQGLPSGANPGDLVTFNFVNPVTAYTLGMMAFQVSYGQGTDHWVESLVIKLLPEMGVAATPNQVSARVMITMNDSSGNSLNPTDSYIWPVCIAVTNSPQPSTVMGTVDGVANNSTQPVQLPSPGNGYTIVSAFQSGFNLTYTATDHQVLLANASCGIDYVGQSGSISASANLQDNKNQVQTATVDAGYIVSSYALPGMQLVPLSGQSVTPVSATMDQLSSVSAAAVLITSWSVQYESVHNLQALRVGSWGSVQINGNVVTLASLSASMWDNSGNGQVNADSSCDVLVVAVP